jgi:hypothetical protein
MATSYGDNHDAIGAWFLGPHAENFEVLERIFQGLLYEQAKARAAYFSNDDDFITPSTGMKASNLFQSNTDTTMPGMAGYLMAMMCNFLSPYLKVAPSYIKPSMSADNPNNVATEASPLTTALEIDVGKQLCEMVGYNINITPDTTFPVAWGHMAPVS